MRKYALSGLSLLTNGARPWPCLHGHGRESEEKKGLIPRRTFGSSLPRKAAVGFGLLRKQLPCRACPAVLYLLLFLLLTTTVHGQGFIGPFANNNNPQAVMRSQPITVNEAKNLPHDSWVTLTGNITGVLPGGHNYTFRDPSGEIAVDIGPREWRGLSVDAADRVEIHGEVKIHRGQISIKVHAITGAVRINTRRAQTNNQPVTINEAKNLPHDSWVILTGNIVNALPEHNNYTFRDLSGEIAVDIGPKEWRGLFVDASDRVEIHGEVKNHRGQVSIKVHAIRKMGV